MNKREIFQILSFIPVIGIAFGYHLFKRQISSWAAYHFNEYMSYQLIASFITMLVINKF